MEGEISYNVNGVIKTINGDRINGFGRKIDDGNWEEDYRLYVSPGEHKLTISIPVYFDTPEINGNEINFVLKDLRVYYFSYIGPRIEILSFNKQTPISLTFRPNITPIPQAPKLITPSPSSLRGAADNSAECSDSDLNNPDDLYIKSNVVYKDSSGVEKVVYDACNGAGTQVNEQYCYKIQGKSVNGTTVLNCPKGCKDGACIK